MKVIPQLALSVLAVALLATLASPVVAQSANDQQQLLSQTDLISPQWQPNYDVAYFTLLSAETGSRGAVTCTDSSLFGNIGSSGARPAVVLTRCAMAGHVISPVSAAVLAQFNNQFDQIGKRRCRKTLSGTLAGVVLAPGVYCFPAAAALTGHLTLSGPSTATWVFLINGNLTGNTFSVGMAGAGKPCNVYWESEGSTTMTTSDLKGNLYAGQAITFTGGTFVGRAMAKKAVTATNAAITGCK